MKIDSEKVGGKIVVTASPDDWLGAEIQVTVSSEDYESEDEAVKAATEMAMERYLESEAQQQELMSRTEDDEAEIA